MADLDEKLKPCPYCGGCCAKIVPIRDGYRAHCTKCGAAGGAEFYGPGDKPSARERAIAAWNRRAYLDATHAQEPDVVGVLGLARDYILRSNSRWRDEDLAKFDTALATLSAKGSEGGAK